LAASKIFRSSATPEKTAEIGSKCRSVVSARRRAIVVLPQPGVIGGYFFILLCARNPVFVSTRVVPSGVIGALLPHTGMTCFPVDPKVGNVKYDEASLVEELIA
jgi:hypothetical protein